VLRSQETSGSRRFEKGKLTASIAGIVLAGMAVTGCAPTSEAPRPTETSFENVLPTLEQELARQIEANRLNREDIVVNRADHASMEDAAAAWIKSYQKCLLHGKVFLLAQNREELYLERTGGGLEELGLFLDEKFSLSENQDVCIDSLVDTTDPNSQGLADFIRVFNRTMVASQMTSRVTISYGEPDFSEISENSIVGKITSTTIIESASNPESIESLVGINLNTNEAGEVKWSFKQQ